MEYDPDVTPDYADIERVVWITLNSAFSRPVNPSDDVADYAPTQVPSEAFRVNGYDGIKYGSQFRNRQGHRGDNVALFSIDEAEYVECHVVKVESVTTTFKRAEESTSYENRTRSEA